MIEIPHIGKAEKLTSLVTLVLLCLSILIPGLAVEGSLPVSKATLLRIGCVALSLFVGLFSYTALLWRRDSKRERGRFAIEARRKICHCSEAGEVMVRVVRQENFLGGDPSDITYCGVAG